MKTYVVGGAVRDDMLGLAVKDRDYVVVGATPEEMARLGFKPVGSDFPVFLHPNTHEEYALARTERKTARGYRGFNVYAAPDVTLEEDLKRRDLTINAMAKSESGELIDPYGGAQDLHAKILRHVSDAFAEDPVRILRVARFAARYGDFSVAPETMTLMQTMAANGEVDALVAERVWQEFAKGLMEAKPSRMFDTLIEAHALHRVAPELSALVHYHRALRTLDAAARDGASLAVRFSVLLAEITCWRAAPEADLQGNAASRRVLTISQRLRVPNECADLAQLTLRWIATIEHATALNASDLLKLMLGADSVRRPARFRELLSVCGYIFGRDDHTLAAISCAYLSNAQTCLAGVDTKAAIASAPDAAAIASAIRAAQLATLASFVDRQHG